MAGEAKPDETVLVSHLKLSEALGLAMQIRNKIESEWHRVVYLHAALIGVMIFFNGQANPFATARVLVYAFYTFNLVFAWASLRESYQGLSRIGADLALFPQPARGGETLAYFRGRSYRHDAALRAVLLVAVWAMVGYLMILPLILGRTPGALGPTP